MGWGPLLAENHRGRRIPRILWAPLVTSALAATLLAEGMGRAGPEAWGALAGLLLTCGAGLVDDLVSAGPRGLRGHLRALASGRMTTGALKVLVGVGAAVVVLALEPPRPWWTRLAGVVLVPACANLWNGLDVRPGRALKAFLPVGAWFLLMGPVPSFPAGVGVLVGAVLAIGPDLRERAMLGDAGSNPLGFAAGLCLYLGLPDGGVPVASAAAVGLNLLAETVTLSRVIDAVPALRALDRLGRLPG
ncbi:hypothetical protein HRbin12_01791 [bacterium HR12]|nr:hypothetical protein HRbin12_01791 [bacterium HR12]